LARQTANGLFAGPGVGKGRQIAAIAFNYFCRGKTKVGGKLTSVLQTLQL
jgi:hypothetical protein